MPGQYPYQYAVVCGWGTVSNPIIPGGHSGLLVFSSEQPWQGDQFPLEKGFDQKKISHMREMLNKLDVGPKNRICEMLTAVLSDEEIILIMSADNYTENSPHLPRIKEIWKKISIQDLENTDKYQKIATRTLNDFYTLLNVGQDLFSGVTPSAGVRLDQYISTHGTAVSDVSFEYETMGRRFPEEYMIFPASTNESQPGIDTTKLHAWWDQKSKAMDAFMFKARRCDFTTVQIPRIHSDDYQKTHPTPEATESDASPAITQELQDSKMDYLLYTETHYPPHRTQMSLAYKDDDGRVKLHALSDKEQATLEDVPIQYQSEKHSGTNRDIKTRSAIQRIASRLPNHNPVSKEAFEKEKYHLAFNNCSTLVREGLGSAGVKLDAMISTPAGLMKDSRKVHGQYSADLLSFVSDCINRMKHDDKGYSEQPSAKLKEFEKIKTALEHMKNPSESDMKHMHSRVEKAANMQRGFNLPGASSTAAKNYKKFLETHADQKPRTSQSPEPNPPSDTDPKTGPGPRR